MSAEILEYLEEDEETEKSDEVSLTLEGDQKAVENLLENDVSAQQDEESSTYRNSLGYKAATLGFGAGFAATFNEASDSLNYIGSDAELLIEYAPKVIEAASSFGEIGGALATGIGAIYCYSRIER